MATLRDGQHLERENTVAQALERATAQLPSRMAERGLSVPDDTGVQGVFEDDGTGVFVYRNWFRTGHAVGTRRLRPY